MITVQVPAPYLSHERSFLQIILRNNVVKRGGLEHQINIVNVFCDLLFNGVAQDLRCEVYRSINYMTRRVQITQP